MNRRGFLKGLLDAAVAVAVTPLAIRSALAMAPKPRPLPCTKYFIPLYRVSGASIPKTAEGLAEYRMSVTEFLDKQPPIPKIDGGGIGWLCWEEIETGCFESLSRLKAIKKLELYP